jgi:hypothetical protein
MSRVFGVTLITQMGLFDKPLFFPLNLNNPVGAMKNTGSPLDGEIMNGCFTHYPKLIKNSKASFLAGCGMDSDFSHSSLVILIIGIQVLMLGLVGLFPEPVNTYGGDNCNLPKEQPNGAHINEIFK